MREYVSVFGPWLLVDRKGLNVEHVTLHHKPGRYAGCPVNYGILAWGDEIVVGFTAGYPVSAGGFRACDRSRPFVPMQARSLDGGHTWQVGSNPCRTPGGVSHDLGYPRTVQRPDGTIVTVCYFNDRLGGDGCIAANPPARLIRGKTAHEPLQQPGVDADAAQHR